MQQDVQRRGTSFTGFGVLNPFEDALECARCGWAGCRVGSCKLLKD